ncbi:MAG: phage holin family protein [Dehalococcoidia bacterium]
MRLLIRWIIIAISVALAAAVVPGIRISESNGWIAVVVMAAVLGLVNAYIRPILAVLSCGLIILTLGLFSLVINAAMFLFASWLAQNVFGVGFYIDGFWPALFGSILVSVVSTILGVTFVDAESR